MQAKRFDFPFRAMGSPCQLSFYTHSEIHARQVFDKVLKRVNILEKRYSRYLPDSLISQINRTAGSGEKIPIDPETAGLLAYAEQCFEESDGLFDVTSGVLRKVWKFNEQQITLPKQAEIEQLLELINWREVIWDQDWFYLARPKMEVDFGGIVKEYAADSVASICYQLNINSGYINMGGDIRVLGPLANGDGWPIAIQDPHYPDQNIAQLPLKQGAIASSGDYQRFIRIKGKRYSHILNPKTGWPVSGLASVSVVAEHCVVAGSISTIAMLSGENGLDWLKNSGAKFICCNHQGELYQN